MCPMTPDKRQGDKKLSVGGTRFLGVRDTPISPHFNSLLSPDIKIKVVQNVNRMPEIFFSLCQYVRMSICQYVNMSECNFSAQVSKSKLFGMSSGC